MHFEPVDNDHPVLKEFDRLTEVVERGRELLNLWGLYDWKMCIDKSLRRVGQCRHTEKEIAFSQTFIHSEWDEIEDTILHEIAHALVGPNHGHDRTWRNKCREVGARPQRLASHKVSSATHNWIMTCPVCGREWKRHRMRERNYGSKCPDCNVEVTIERI